jgi:hypothetical protein
MKEETTKWYKIKGTIQLMKNDKLIREYKFQNAYDRRRMFKIWNSEIKPNGKDYYELFIIND